MSSAKRNLLLNRNVFIDPIDYPRGTLIKSAYPSNKTTLRILSDHFSFFETYEIDGDRRGLRSLFKNDIYRKEYIKVEPQRP